MVPKRVEVGFKSFVQVVNGGGFSVGLSLGGEVCFFFFFSFFFLFFFFFFFFFFSFFFFNDHHT